MVSGILLCASLLALPAAPALAQTGPSLNAPDDVGMISIQSKHAVRATADRLEQAIRDKGLRFYGRIDHRAHAEAAKLALRPATLLLWGDPRNDTLLLHQNLTLGLDLPLKYLVWESEDGLVFISWNNPYYLAQRHGLAPNTALLSQLSQTLVQLAKKAAA